MISSVGFSTATLSISSVQQKTSTASTSAASSVAPSGDSAEISGPGKLFAELKELASSDPEKFKTVAADVAAKIRAAIGDTTSADSTDGTDSASSTSGAGGAASRLADLAAKFEEAAQTGDVSVLAPPAGGGGRPRGVGAYNQLGQPQGPPPPPPTDSANGVDLKSLFESINQEVTEALSA